MAESEDNADAPRRTAAANDNGMAETRVDAAVRRIARAIGRQLAREHVTAWEEQRREQAANDNRRE